ncbi:MAG: hypothetical protein ACR2KP_22180, partial [Egibacteraceae bacterium]
AGLVIVFTSLAIYFTLAMRPVLLAALIVFLPVAHALSVWTPMRRVQVRAWSLAFAVLLADAAILTMFAVTNTVMAQPKGVDRLIFGTFGLLLAALAPAALARIVGAPELQTAVQSMSRGSRVAAVGAGALAVKGALTAAHVTPRTSHGAGGLQPGNARGGGSTGPGAGPGGGPASGPGGRPSGAGGTSPTGGDQPGGSTSQPAGAATAQNGSRLPQSGASAPADPPTTAPPAAPTSATATGTSASADTKTGGWQAALTRPTVGART